MQFASLFEIKRVFKSDLQSALASTFPFLSFTTPPSSATKLLIDCSTTPINSSSLHNSLFNHHHPSPVPINRSSFQQPSRSFNSIRASALNRRDFIVDTAAAAVAISLAPVVGSSVAKADTLSEWERVFLPIDPGVVLLDMAFVPDDLSHEFFSFDEVRECTCCEGYGECGGKFADAYVLSFVLNVVEILIRICGSRFFFPDNKMIRTKLTLTRWSADWKNATQYYEQAATAFRFAKKHEKAKIAFEKASKGQEMLSSYPFKTNCAFLLENHWCLQLFGLNKKSNHGMLLSIWSEVADFYRRAAELYNECGSNADENLIVKFYEVIKKLVKEK
ncbi:hypothetical protein QVD17_12944 [Tagetes erecta]|uniref:Gamma-soluble NSF attachment protein n=1 Tax=Tagetes erecta TaxID=13708 RepID=A0AAD8L002_TARER|nr:hypothetical protein QVD17_12944 [Tagetes erecta]